MWPTSPELNNKIDFSSISFICTKLVNFLNSTVSKKSVINNLWIVGSNLAMVSLCLLSGRILCMHFKDDRRVRRIISLFNTEYWLRVGSLKFPLKISGFSIDSYMQNKTPHPKIPKTLTINTLATHPWYIHPIPGSVFLWLWLYIYASHAIAFLARTDLNILIASTHERLNRELFEKVF